jgi:hypothetical protein
MHGNRYWGTKPPVGLKTTTSYNHHTLMTQQSTEGLLTARMPQHSARISACRQSAADTQDAFSRFNCHPHYMITGATVGPSSSTSLTCKNRHGQHRLPQMAAGCYEPCSRDNRWQRGRYISKQHLYSGVKRPMYLYKPPADRPK